MRNINPNRWYNLASVFGQGLNKIEEIRNSMVSEERDGVENIVQLLVEGDKSRYADMITAFFKGSFFRLCVGMTGRFSDSSMRKYLGINIYFPLDVPDFTEDIDGVEEPHEVAGAGHWPLIANKFGNVSFIIESPHKEDLTGNIYEINGALLQQYKYLLLMRSDKGTFISDGPVYRGFVGKEFEPSVIFQLWKSRESDNGGLLYLPLNSDKLSNLEIKLEEKA